MKQGFLVKCIDTLALVQNVKDTGFDFVFYDLEHGQLSTRKMHDLILYGNAIGLDSWVRVCECTKSEIARIADCGAKGIMVPMVETHEQAQRLVSLCKYPPIGNRGYAGGAHTQYGPSGNHQINMETANASMQAIVQIESVAGMENLDAILSTPGIDAAIVGPVDLGISMGLVDQRNHPALLRAVETVAKACKTHGIKFGIIGTPSFCEQFKSFLDIIVDGNDLFMMRESLTQTRKYFEERIMRDE